MGTEAARKAKKGGKERRKRKAAPKERRETGEEEEVEEGEPEKDTLSHSMIRWYNTAGDFPSRRYIVYFTRRGFASFT